MVQTYGYHNLPLLLSLASPPLAILLPNPLPASAPATLPKFSYTSLRKSLRLLIDDNPEALDEIENDISFVYSGYAPISIRLVQCVAQRGGVLSNPADRDKAARQGDNNAVPESKVQAHAINGWKGFEDVLATIPGETVDILQPDVGRTSASPSLGKVRHGSGCLSVSMSFQAGPWKPPRQLSYFSLVAARILRSPHCGGLVGKTEVIVLLFISRY